MNQTYGSYGNKKPKRLADPDNMDNVDGVGRMFRRHSHIFEHTNHHAFYPIDPTLANADVAFRHYTQFIPATTPDTAWIPQRDYRTIYLSRNDQDTHWIRTNRRGSGYLMDNDDPENDTFVLPQKGNGLYDAINEHFEKTHYYHKQNTHFSISTGSREINRSILDKLTDDNETLYSLHATLPTENELREIDGIGRKTAAGFYNQAQYHTNDTNEPYPTECIIATCPACDAMWKAPVYDDMPDANVHSVRQKLYCPNCEHTDIPETHTTDKQPFNPLGN